MKRTLKLAFAAMLISMVSVAAVNGQEKENKNEKQIKIIVSDNSGTKVIIDTLIAGDQKVKTVGSKVIVFSGDTDTHEHMAHMESKEGPVFITVESDGKGGADKVMTWTIADSAVVHKEGDSKVMTWTSVDSGSQDKKIIYISQGDVVLKDGEKKYNIEVRTDEAGKSAEKSTYVIAKDGMVVTIEGEDETKVKELAGTIESKLGVSSAGKTEVKQETKKTTKK